MKLEKSIIFLLLMILLFFLAGLAAIESTSAQEKIEGYVVGLQPNVSTGYSNVMILDMAGTEHNFSVPSADLESKDIILGDYVRVSIFRDAGGNLTDNRIEINEISAEISGEIIEGEVTGVNNSDATGSSELTIKDADGNEHVVNVPLYQGENIKNGNNVSIKVVGKADGIIGSVSKVGSPEESTGKESQSLPGLRGVFAVFAVLVSAIYRRRI